MEIKFFHELTEQQINLIAETNFHYWKAFNPKLEHDRSVGHIREMATNIDKLPLGIAAYAGDDLIGFVTLRTDRLQRHLDRNPWISNLLVMGPFRQQGMATALLNVAYDKYRELGYQEVYAWTDQVPDFLLKMGWTDEGEITTNQGGTGRLFKYQLKK